VDDFLGIILSNKKYIDPFKVSELTRELEKSNGVEFRKKLIDGINRLIAEQAL
jgi:hypothetical protein